MSKSMMSPTVMDTRTAEERSYLSSYLWFPNPIGGLDMIGASYGAVLSLRALSALDRLLHYDRPELGIVLFTGVSGEWGQLLNFLDKLSSPVMNRKDLPYG
jgi:hypothetical protein